MVEQHTTDADNVPIDVILCDYQVSYVGPAVIDLANTLYTSSHSSLRGPDYDRLVQIYQRELSETLSKLKYARAIPTLTDIQVQLLQRGICHAAIGLYVFAARSYEKMGEMDVAVVTGDSDSDKEFVRNMAENVKDNEGVKFLLTYFDRRGYFD